MQLTKHLITYTSIHWVMNHCCRNEGERLQMRGGQQATGGRRLHTCACSGHSARAQKRKQTRGNEEESQGDRRQGDYNRRKRQGRQEEVRGFATVPKSKQPNTAKEQQHNTHSSLHRQRQGRLRNPTPNIEQGPVATTNFLTSAGGAPELI